MTFTVLAADVGCAPTGGRRAEADREPSPHTPPARRARHPSTGYLRQPILAHLIYRCRPIDAIDGGPGRLRYPVRSGAQELSGVTVSNAMSCHGARGPFCKTELGHRACVAGHLASAEPSGQRRRRSQRRVRSPEAAPARLPAWQDRAMTSDRPATPAGSARADGLWADRLGSRCPSTEPPPAGAAAPVARSRS